jgi:hypothetical protein
MVSQILQGPAAAPNRPQFPICRLYLQLGSRDTVFFEVPYIFRRRWHPLKPKGTFVKSETSAFVRRRTEGFDCMEISDRRFQELVATIGNLEGRRDQVFFASRPARTRTPRVQTQVAARQFERQSADLSRPTANIGRDIKEILLVDTDTGSLHAAQKALRLVADVDACTDFQAARERLLGRPPDLLVTNLRLQAYNGLHLVYLSAGSPTRCIAYTDHHDVVLAREVQAAGAFYELANRLPDALAAYVHAKLPPRDRRSPKVLDRDTSLPNGRRATDRFSADTRSSM